jgi:hypothetical protein
VASDSIHTVFISSTFEDLREERAEVQKAVLRLGCLPIGMELFPSADNDAWGYIQGEIKRSDYYVLLVGGRYGSVADDGMSYTEKEYRYARELNKPCLVFVRSNKQAVTPDKLEQNEDRRTRLHDFISELNANRLAQRFETPHQLGFDAYYSLTKLREQRPIIGYVRSQFDNSPSKRVLQGRFANSIRENETLKTTIVGLRQELIGSTARISANTNSSTGDRYEALLLKYEMLLAERKSLRDQILPFDQRPFDGHEIVVMKHGKISPNAPDITLGKIFLYIADYLTHGAQPHQSDLATVAASALEEEYRYKQNDVDPMELPEPPRCLWEIKAFHIEEYLSARGLFFSLGSKGITNEPSQNTRFLTSFGKNQFDLLASMYYSYVSLKHS